MAGEFESYFSGDDGSPETIVIINCVLNALLMLISITGNTLVLAAILRTPSLRSPTTILFCSLAVSDLLVGLAVQPVYVAFYLTRNFYLFEVTRTMGFIASGVSLLTMTAIAVDRFLALHYHMRYPNLMTTSRAMYLSAILWIIASLMSCSGFLNKRVYEFTIVVTIPISLLTNAVCYIKIYCIVRQHQLQIQIQQLAVAGLNREHDFNMHRSRKRAKNAFIYFIVMILCYTPLFISMSISAEQWNMEWILADTFVFINSSINPFLYCWRLGELRAVVLKTAKQCFCKPIEQNY